MTNLSESIQNGKFFLNFLESCKKIKLTDQQKFIAFKILKDFVNTDIKELKITTYQDNDIQWLVLDTHNYKVVTNSNKTYHLYFNKLDGITWRFGVDPNDEPKFCPLGPEILDLEISVNGCPTIGGRSCKFCYKNNTNAAPSNMTFETFKKIVDSMPKCLYSIAFGITGTQTNPDFIKMMEYCRENDIVPNYTLSGADLTDDIVKDSCRLCGAVAVSCYVANKQLCYDTIKRFYDCKNDMHINMHIVLSEDPEQLTHVWDVLNDIKNKKIIGLRNIVFLRIKPVGRAKIMNCQIHKDTYKKIVEFCLENKIGFGFDSCSARTIRDVLKDMGRGEFCESCEPCESSKFSSYINEKGEYWNCSFCERDPRIKKINVLDYNDFRDVWNHEELLKIRNLDCQRSCPMFDLDSKN